MEKFMTSIQFLPLAIDLETREVLKQTAVAHRALAELKGVAQSIPNQNILINTLTLQEAKDSSAIENIITTQDELFKSQAFDNPTLFPSAKEVSRYSAALRKGFDLVRNQGLLTTNFINDIQSQIEPDKAGFRKIPGTILRNQTTGEVIYTPPQNYDEIVELMGNLDKFINDQSVSDLDPLIKMALIHFQFESIHPYYDGNGRTGRVINILYLVKEELLSIPILYLSGYIIRNKDTYYRLFQEVRDNQNWDKWVLFILKGVEETSRETISLVRSIKGIMLSIKHQIREQFPGFYSQDLVNNLFYHPYTKIAFIQKELGVSRITATRYLKELSKAGILEELHMGRSNYYVNKQLLALLAD
jgi:Fic family protein